MGKIGQGGWDHWKETGTLEFLFRQTVTNMEGKWAQASARIYIEPQMDETPKVPGAEAIKTGIKRSLYLWRWLRILTRQILWASEMNDGSTAVAGLS